MHITLADVISANGKLTNGGNPDIHSWSSAEDWKHFLQLKREHDVIIIDRVTYEAARPPAEPGKLRIVLTRRAADFAHEAVPDQLEFMDIAPLTLVQQLEARGRQRALVAGGARTCTIFLAANLVDDLFITFEPLFFGTGKPMFDETLGTVPLQLQSIKQLNARGSLLAHYTIRPA